MFKIFKSPSNFFHKSNIQSSIIQRLLGAYLNLLIIKD